jgi:hypothetical protein
MALSLQIRSKLIEDIFGGIDADLKAELGGVITCGPVHGGWSRGIEALTTHSLRRPIRGATRTTDRIGRRGLSSRA